jgi:hypothetical protein
MMIQSLHKRLSYDLILYLSMGVTKASEVGCAEADANITRVGDETGVSMAEAASCGPMRLR